MIILHNIMRLTKTISKSIALFYASFQIINVLSNFIIKFYPKYVVNGFDYWFSNYNYFLLGELFVFSIVLVVGVLKSKRFCLMLWMWWAVIEFLFIFQGFYMQSSLDLLMISAVVGKRIKCN